MEELNLFVILSTTIVCILIFILIIYIFQKKGYELLEEKIKNNKIMGEADSENREKRISELIGPIAQ